MKIPKTERRAEKILKTYVFEIKKRYEFGDFPEEITIHAQANVVDDEFVKYADDEAVRIMEETMQRVKRHIFDR